MRNEARFREKMPFYIRRIAYAWTSLPSDWLCVYSVLYAAAKWMGPLSVLYHLQLTIILSTRGSGYHYLSNICM